MEKAKAAYHSRDGVVPNPKLKLLDQVREVIRVKHYSIRTEDAYVQWIKRFIFFSWQTPPQGNGGGGNRCLLDRFGTAEESGRRDAEPSAQRAGFSLQGSIALGIGRVFS